LNILGILKKKWERKPTVRDTVIYLYTIFKETYCIEIEKLSQRENPLIAHYIENYRIDK